MQRFFRSIPALMRPIVSRSSLTMPSFITRSLFTLSTFSSISNISQSTLGSLIIGRGFKVKSAVRKRCKDCYSVRRDGVLFIRCKAHPRHKQRQGRSKAR